MSQITKRYRETNTGDIYSITYDKQSNGTWKMFSHEHPSNPYDNSASQCHLYSSGEICVHEGQEPRSYERAQAIVFVWMEGYSQFVRSGVFPTGRKRVHV